MKQSSMNKHITALLFIFFQQIICLAQDGSKVFEKVYDGFKKINSIVYNASFKGAGKNAGNVTEAEGRIAMQKSEFSIVKYKSISISEIGILQKINFEDILYDGENVYNYDQENGQYENKGTLANKGKNYLGYSSILYNNIVVTFEEFNKNKSNIIYTTEKNGYSLKLPATKTKGEIVIFFEKNNSIPKKIIRYTEVENTADLVTLSIRDVRIDCKFPNKFFSIFNTKTSLDKGDHNLVVRDSPEVENLNASLLPIGTIAPNWELTNSDGKKRQLSDYKGKVVIMDFWATWCAPCIKAQPQLQTIHNTFKNVVVIGMDYLDRNNIDLNEYKKKNKLSYEMVLNSERIAEAYKVRVLPTVYVIDKSGKIIYSALGYNEKEEELLMSIIDKATR